MLLKSSSNAPEEDICAVKSATLAGNNAADKSFRWSIDKELRVAKSSS